MDLRTIYSHYADPSRSDSKLHTAITQVNWLSTGIEFDPRTGDPLPKRLTAFLHDVSAEHVNSPPRDRVWRLVEHARESVNRLIRSRTQSPRRTHEEMPISRVREMDASSMVKLSNRPGRTIREKLAGKPYLQAVRRYQSEDLTENRLLKHFCLQLIEVLRTRTEMLGAPEDPLILTIAAWIRTDECRSIADWDNPPPNNALLSHHDYRKIWNSWRWLQSLEDDLDNDISQVVQREEVITEWSNLSLKFRSRMEAFAEQPVLFNYDNFEILPWVTPLPTSHTLISKKDKKVISQERLDKACIDLSGITPKFAADSTKLQSADEPFVWQKWFGKDGGTAINLFESEAILAHPESELISTLDIFNSDTFKEEYLREASHEFATKIKESLGECLLIWLYPDQAHDLKTRPLRQSINFKFAKNQPLPKSIAAVFDQVRYDTIPDEGMSVTVIDRSWSVTTSTKVVAKFSSELKDEAPTTRGFYWERCPTSVLKNSEVPTKDPYRFGMPFFTPNVGWSDDKNIEIPEPYEDPESSDGLADKVIVLKDSPACGGMRLAELQEMHPNVVFWRDRVPELAIEVIDADGLFTNFYLVSKNVVLETKIGVVTTIPVFNRFTLDAGRDKFEFPLCLGNESEKIDYSVTLESTDFPLEKDEVCELNLTYKYGADDPYTLKFRPIDRRIKTVNAKWTKVDEKSHDNQNIPQISPASSWEGLEDYDWHTQGKVNLLELLIDSLKELKGRIPTGKKPQLLIVKTDVLLNSQGDGYLFARTSDGEDVYCGGQSFDFESEMWDLEPGDKIYATVARSTSGNSPYKAKRCSVDPILTGKWSKSDQKYFDEFRKKSFLNRAYRIWEGGKSISDTSCPEWFRKEFTDLVNHFEACLPSSVFVSKVVPILANSHKDMPESCQVWIRGKIQDSESDFGYGEIDEEFFFVRENQEVKALGSSIGTMSENWQVEIFDTLMVNCDVRTLRALAYNFWQQTGLLNQLTVDQITKILHQLDEHLGNYAKNYATNEQSKLWSAECTDLLCLLFALLETRRSQDASIRELLHPKTEMSQSFINKLDDLARLCVLSGARLTGWLQIQGAEKNPRDKTPTLISVIRQCLTGNSNMNAIRVSIGELA